MTKFNNETQEKLIIAIRKGAPYKIACKYAGISFEIFRQWKMKANNEKIPKFVAFFDRIKEAEGETALIWLDKIDAAMKNGAWQAAAWKLERRYREHFSSDPTQLLEVKKLIKLLSKGDSSNVEVIKLNDKEASSQKAISND